MIKSVTKIGFKLAGDDPKGQEGDDRVIRVDFRWERGKGKRQLEKNAFGDGIII